MSTSDGSTADYYELPAGATELQDLISHRNLNAQDGEIFRAIYRKGRASHSDELRDARKVLFYAQAEVKRLEKLQAEPSSFGQQNMIDPADVEPASAIDDDSERMQAIGRAVEPVEDYWNIQIGDLVSVISIGGFSDCTGLSVGDIVEVTSVDNDESLKTVSGGSWGSIGYNYKFHSRPSA